MTFKLQDYKGHLTTFSIDIFDQIEDITKLVLVYTILSGDEVVYAYYNNALIKKFDSSGARLHDLLDEMTIITLEELQLLHHDE